MPRYRWCTQDPDLQGPRNATTPHLEDCTPYSDDHATCWGWQDAGAISARTRTTTTPDAIPHSVLPTVLDCCTPATRGENDDFRDPLYMYPSLLVSIKGGGGHPLRGSVVSLGITLHTEHILTSSPNIATRHAQLLF